MLHLDRPGKGQCEQHSCVGSHEQPLGQADWGLDEKLNDNEKLKKKKTVIIGNAYIWGGQSPGWDIAH